MERIFDELEHSSLHLLKEQTEVPFEIYVPVYEENDIAFENITVRDIEASGTSAQDYFSYWGLYFLTEEDAIVYDLKNQTLIDGTLHMLNR